MSTARNLNAAERYPIVRQRLQRRRDELRHEVWELQDLIEYYDDKGMNSMALKRQLDVLQVQARGLDRLLA